MITWIIAIFIALAIILFISAMLCGAFYLIDGIIRSERWAIYLYRIIVAILGLIMFLLLVNAIHMLIGNFN